jgi:sulfate adenylyltransferase subunit 1
VFWGRGGAGTAQVGQTVKVLPSGQTATVAQVLGHTRQPRSVPAGHSAGIVLDREVDVSRGDWLLAVAPTTGAADEFDTPSGPFNPGRELKATVAWMDDEPLVAGRVYWALHGHRWIKAKIRRIVHKLDINTLAQEDASQLDANAIGHVELILQEAVATLPYSRSRVLGSLILVDTASHKTAGAVLIN